MNINNKIKFFYNGIKMKDTPKPYKANPHWEITIPAAVAFLALLGTVIALPIVLLNKKKKKA